MTRCLPIIFCISCQQCQSNQNEVANQPQKPIASDESGRSNIKIKENSEGTGIAATIGDEVQIRYRCGIEGQPKLLTNHDEAKPLKITLGDESVIRGLENGILGMKASGSRTFTIPPALGYGNRPHGEEIPPNATIECNTKLIKVVKK